MNASLQSPVGTLLVLLPESFRGGCSFGTGHTRLGGRFLPARSCHIRASAQFWQERCVAAEQIFVVLARVAETGPEKGAALRDGSQIADGAWCRRMGPGKNVWAKGGGPGVAAKTKPAERHRRVCNGASPVLGPVCISRSISALKRVHSPAWGPRYRAGADGRCAVPDPRSSRSTGRSSRRCGPVRTAR